MSDTPAPSTPSPEKPTAGATPLERHRAARAEVGNREPFAKLPLRDLDKDIESELAEALGGQNIDQLYGDLSGRKKSEAKPAAGGKQKGKIHSIRGADVFVDMPGQRSQGVLSALQFPEGPPAIGSEVEFTVEGYDRQNGLIVLSLKGAAVQADWSTIANGMIVEARVTGTNKGGLEVMVNNIRGFMPISQIELFRVDNIEQYVNQRLTCVVTDVDPSERNLVVSRRALLEKEREEKREKLWTELAEGQIREGVVRSVRDFGAFVDLGGADGLLHVSEMSWTRVKDASEVLQPGQTIKVIVLKLDRETRKMSLGLKQLQISPWQNIEERSHVGDIVSGKVTRLMEFGAFVELEPGIEGLLHISELAGQRVWRVRDVVQEGQDLQVQILNIDKEGRKLSLSLKAALAKLAPQPEPKPDDEEEEEVEETPKKPPRPRTTPLRGGVGGETQPLI